jgi:hypothetical protein
LYRYDSVNEITARYVVPVPAGERIGIKVRALVGFSSEAFVNIKVTTPLGSPANVKVLVYWCVVTVPISLATVNNTTYRFSEPPHDKPELMIGRGYAYAGRGVSGFCIRCCRY